MGWFGRKKKTTEGQYDNVWKEDFSDCITADYLPNFSVCQNSENTSCRFVANFEGMILCSHPKHKSFMPEGSEPFDPLRGGFSN